MLTHLTALYSRPERPPLETKLQLPNLVIPSNLFRAVHRHDLDGGLRHRSGGSTSWEHLDRADQVQRDQYRFRGCVRGGGREDQFPGTCAVQAHPGDL